LFTGWLAVAAGITLCYLSKNPDCWLNRKMTEMKYLSFALFAGFGLVAGILDSTVLGTRPSVATALFAAFAFVAFGEGSARGEGGRTKWLGFGLMLAAWFTSFIFITYYTI
jgi:hypothetical protein